MSLPAMLLPAGAVPSSPSPLEMLDSLSPEMLSPLVESLKPVLTFFAALFGSLLGLYLILLILRFFQERKKVSYLKNINFDLDYLNQHFNLPYSHQKKKVSKKVLPLAEYHRLEKEREGKEKGKKEKRKG